jgi:hypothetical protein
VKSGTLLPTFRRKVLATFSGQKNVGLEAVASFQMLVPTDEITWRHVPEEITLYKYSNKELLRQAKTITERLMESIVCVT